ncbi:putative Enolase-phosphatase E1 [Diplocarpon rosae]|nr:putative Enolase-phosphatase E1 [Diplocarpon rosae]
MTRGTPTTWLSPLNRKSRRSLYLDNLNTESRALDPVLATQWDAPAFASYRDAFPPEHRTSPTALRAHVHDLVANDVKIFYLKNLQGYLWLTGYQSGVLSCPLFPDVRPALHRWHAAGIPILIYSSGSVAAQKLLFQYTSGSEERGEKDLRGLISGYFDTVHAGPKGERSSYEKIAATRGESVGTWLFLSDRVEEVEAAKAAGMMSAVVLREGNAALTESEKGRHVVVRSFEEIGR